MTWSSKKQYIIVLLSTESEYIVQMHAAKEALWLQSFVNEMRGEKDKPLRLNCDNQGARALTKDNKFHSWTKHIDLWFHFIREVVEDNKLLITYIPTEENMVNIFTKALARPSLRDLLKGWGWGK